MQAVEGISPHADRFQLRGCPIAYRIRVQSRLITSIRQGAMDCVQYFVKTFIYVLSQEAQNEVAVFLQQCIFPAVSPVRVQVSEMLCSV